MDEKNKKNLIFFCLKICFNNPVIFIRKFNTNLTKPSNKPSNIMGTEFSIRADVDRAIACVLRNPQKIEISWHHYYADNDNRF